jgi:hypothetical protein
MCGASHGYLIPLVLVIFVFITAVNADFIVPYRPTCLEIRDLDGRHLDAEYYLMMQGKVVQVYCYMMGPNVSVPGAPFAYISLTADNQTNVAQWEFGDIMTTTVFHRVRLNESTMRIYTGDCKCDASHIVLLAVHMTYFV